MDKALGGHLAICTECTIEYNWTLGGESLLGDLNFCDNTCSNIWLARQERQEGKYTVATKEWCDKILADADWLDETLPDETITKEELEPYINPHYKLSPEAYKEWLERLKHLDRDDE